MPSLKDIHCFIELTGTGERLQEFSTSYSDGCVETFVAVPSTSQPFEVRLASSDFIAPGLAMYVFIDGVYQCNRNRQNLKVRFPPDRKSLVEFRVRQKEEKQKNGSMIAREWTFEKLNIDSANGAPTSCPPAILDDIGCIEVVVLRCLGFSKTKSASKAAHKSPVKNMNMDGADDDPGYPLGLDGTRDGFGKTQIDDRELPGGPGRPVAGYGTPVGATSRVNPPPLSPRSYRSYAELATDRSRRPTQWGQRVTPAPSISWHDIPDAHSRRPSHRSHRMNATPHRSRTASVALPAPSSRNASGQGPDLNALDQLLRKAVSRGEVREQREEGSVLGRNATPTITSQELPGAWPSPPGTSPLEPFPPLTSLGTPFGHKDVGSSVSSIPWGRAAIIDRPKKNDNWGLRGRSATEDIRSSRARMASRDSNGSWRRARSQSTRRRPRSSAREGDGSDTRPLARSPTSHTSLTKSWITGRTHRSSVPSMHTSAWASEVDKEEWTKIDKPSEISGKEEWYSLNAVTHSSASSTVVPVGRRSSTRNLSTWDVQSQTSVSVIPEIEIPQPSGLNDADPQQAFMKDDILSLFSENKNDCFAAWANHIEKSRELLGHETSASHKSQHSPPRSRASKTILTLKDDDEWETLASTTKLARKPSPKPSNPVHSSPQKPTLTQPAHGTPPKPYWKLPTAPISTTLPFPTNSGQSLPPEPLHTISLADAQKKGVEHQVRAGKGTRYEHYFGRPQYMDTLEKPYAIFRFKYRSRPTLAALLNMDIPECPVIPVRAAVKADAKEGKEKLRDMPKEELIEQFVKLKRELEGREKDGVKKEKEKGGEEAMEVVGLQRTEEWVRKLSVDDGWV